jgi:hypothetical protein
MPPLRLGTVTFQSATTFQARDFMGNILAGALMSNAEGASNELAISFSIGDATNISRNATLTWALSDLLPSKPMFPDKITTRANQYVTSEILIRKIDFANENTRPSEMYPENIIGCKLLVLARGTVNSQNAITVVDKAGNTLTTTSYLGQPSKRRIVFYCLLTFMVLSTCVLFFAVIRHKR